MCTGSYIKTFAAHPSCQWFVLCAGEAPAGKKCYYFSDDLLTQFQQQEEQQRVLQVWQERNQSEVQQLWVQKLQGQVQVQSGVAVGYLSQSQLDLWWDRFEQWQYLEPCQEAT